MKTVTVKCNLCGKSFEKPKGEYTRKVKLKTDFYCSRSCSSKNPKQIERINSYTQNFWTKDNTFCRNRLDEFSPFRDTFRRLKYRNKEIGITLQDLKDLWESQNGTCPMTGWKLELPTQSKNYRLTIKTASLDRIDSSKGYVVGNIRFVSVIHNFAKNVFSDDDVIEFAKAVASIRG
jgi:hypothetical protein